MTNPLIISEGEVYGSWTVISSATSTLDGKRRSLCKCNCGTMTLVINSYLINGMSRKCKRCRRPISKKRLNSIQQKQIALRYVNGESSVELANEFVINVGTVLNYVKKFGFKPRDNAEVGIRNRKPPGVAAFNQTFKNKKALAKYRGLQWQLTKEEFKQIVEQNCHYCGSPPKNIKKTSNGYYIHNGIDRIKSHLGYTLNNAVPCCITCNRAKSNMTTEEFQNWMYALINNQINKR